MCVADGINHLCFKLRNCTACVCVCVCDAAAVSHRMFHMQVSPGALSTLLSSLSLSSEASEATPTSPAGAVAEPLTVERARSVREKAVAAVAVPQSIVDVMVDLRTFMQVRPLYKLHHPC